MSMFSALPLGVMGLAMLALTACGAAPVDSSEAEAMLDEEEELGVQASALEEVTVGVIPGNNVDCDELSSSSEMVEFDMDNEHHDNRNVWDGWVGRFYSHYAVTKLRFCNVRARDFKNPKGDADDSYAVLKLSATCPSGSKTLIRYFDNEDEPCGASGPIGGGILPGGDTCGTKAIYGDAAPSTQSGTNVFLHMCVFEGKSSGSSNPFPNFGDVEWGVFGGGGKVSSRSGYVYTDDEDDDNNNRVEGDSVNYRAIMEATRNTKLFTRRVNPD
jgi:hypothetical protein